jgi:hypothetical protein
VDITLSIVIVAYRSAAEIGDCLGSIPPDIGGLATEVVVAANFLG